MMESIQTLRTQTIKLNTEDFIQFFTDKYGDKIALASSFGAEDQVLTDMLCKATAHPYIFTLDTGRLNQQTYDVMQKTRDKYGISIKITFPDTTAVTQMVTEKGPNLMYESIENRKQCCAIRKVKPLKKILAKLDVWITGLRREQAVTRSVIQRIEFVEANNLIKLNPLADWTTDRVWDYIKHHHVPYNTLHDQGYASIGCAPCTRAIKSGEDIRAGRWWWETPETKECGLHIKDGKVVRKQHS